MNKYLTNALLCALLLPSVWAQSEYEEEKARVLRERLVRGQTGIPAEFNNFSKESDEELMQMLKTMNENRGNLSPDKGKAKADSWEQFQQDLKTELDRRGRTPDGGWKKPYENADKNKQDINKELNEQIKRREFEKAETAVNQPPQETVTSSPPVEAAGAGHKVEQPAAAEERGANSGRAESGSSSGTGEANQAGKGAANTSQPPPKTQAELAESARQKLEHGFQNDQPVAVSREEMKAFAAEHPVKGEGSAAAAGEEGAAGMAKPALPEGEGLSAGGKVMKVGGEIMLGVGAFDMGKDVGQFINGEKSAKDLAKDTMDMATGGVTGVIRDRGGDYAKGSVAVEHEQQAKDQARSVEIGNKLQKYVPLDERKEIMAGIARGDDSLLDKKLDELKAQGKEFTRISPDAVKPGTSKSDSENLIPDRQIAHVEADENSDWQHGFGLPERTGQLIGGIYQGVKEDVKMVASIPVNAVQTTLGTEETNADEKEQKKKDAKIGDRLIALGADPAKVKDALDAQSTGDFEPMNDLVREAVEKKKRLESQRVAKSTDDVSKPQLTKSPLFGSSDESSPTDEAKDFAISDGANGSMATPERTMTVTTPERTMRPNEVGSDIDDFTPERTMSVTTPERTMTRANEVGSSLDDFGNPPNAEDATAATTSAAVSGADAIAKGVRLDTSGFARGQAKEDAEASRPKVQGDYAEATRLENELHKAEEKWRRAVAEARRVAAQKRAAHELALQQQQIAETQRRQYEAYQEMCARRRAYEASVAQQPTQYYRQQPRRQQQSTNPVHQDGGVIADTPR